MLILKSPAFVEGLALKLGSSPGATDPIQLFPSCDFSDQETDMAMDSLVDVDSVTVRSRKPGLLKHQLQLVKRKDVDRYEIAAVPGSLSFEKGFFLFIRACQLLTQNIEGVVLVGLAGPSGAGKTVFSEKVSNFMPNIALISMDDYNDSSRVIDGNYDDPRLTDYDTLLDNLQNLRQGKAVEIPIYDFKSSRRIGYRRLEVPSSRIVIIEGIYALSARLRALLDLRVSVTGGVHFDLVKRVLRDINRSGQEPEDIIHQISETVYPMYKAFIEPDLETAHIKIVNKFNPFSGFQNATYILKSSHTVTEDEIRKVLSPDHTESEEEIYDMYLLPPGEDPETCQSYLRMRNRDGKYSLMFEEWVIDEPFIISPRITFEVSVRLLGGLMALGYEIATILKRISHVFSDDKVTIKVDKLEQLQRKYVQIQGKERSITAETGKRLGLEGYYIPYSYIEQIQLEKLTAEVMALPEDLKAKLSLGENMLQSPTPSFSWIAEARPGVRNLYSKSWTRNATKDIECKQFGRQRSIKQPHLIWSEDNGNHVDEKHHNKGIEHSEDQDHVGVSEQLQSINERLDELISRLGELESRVSLAAHGNLQRSGSCTIGIAESFGNSECGLHGNANANANGNGNKANGHMAYPSADAMLLEEVKLLCRGQYHITAQLDVLSNFLHGNRVSKYANGKSKGKLQGWFRSMRTGDVGFTSASIFIAALSTATLIVAVKLCQRTRL